MGQGAHTGLAAIVAEELDADFASLRVVNAANGDKPGGGDVYGTPAGGGFIQLTGASTSTVGYWARYRLVAAQARARLVAAAAEAWGVPAEEVEVDSGVVSHAGNGKRTGFGDLAIRAAQLPVPDDVPPEGSGPVQADRARGQAPGRHSGEDPRPDAVRHRRHPARDADRGGAASAQVRRHAGRGRRQRRAGRARRHRGDPDRGGRRGRRRDIRRRAAGPARASGGLGRQQRRAAQFGGAAGRAPAAGRVRRAGSGGPGGRRRRGRAVGRRPRRRCDLRAALPRARPDGTEQRRVPDGRGRHPRAVDRHRGPQI